MLGFSVISPTRADMVTMQLSKLAQVQGVSPRALMSPYWRSIGITVVKDLQSRPQIAQLLTDLLGMDIPEFLALTQTYTLPYLVVLKKPEIIRKIAQARGKESSVWSTLMANSNMASILALLLVQQSNDVEDTTMALLRHACEEFKNVDLADVARSEPINIAFELLQAAGEEDDRRKARVSLPLSCPL